jgi:hypothetical protein
MRSIATMETQQIAITTITQIIHAANKKCDKFGTRCDASKLIKLDFTSQSVKDTCACRKIEYFKPKFRKQESVFSFHPTSLFSILV